MANSLMNRQKFDEAKSATAASQRPSPAERARTSLDVALEGTLSTLVTEEGVEWPAAHRCEFAQDAAGRPLVLLPSSEGELVLL